MICKQLGKKFQSTALTILDGKSNSSSVIFLKLQTFAEGLLPVSCSALHWHRVPQTPMVHPHFPSQIAINWVSTMFGQIQIGSTPMYIYIYAHQFQEIIIMMNDSNSNKPQLC